MFTGLSPAAHEGVTRGGYARFAMDMTRTWIGRILQLDQLERLRAELAQDASPQPVFHKLLRTLDLSLDCPEADPARIPRRGSALVVANHPTGIADGIALGALLARVRPDVRFLANSWLARFEEIRPYLIPVDPFARGRANARAWREAIEWLKAGHLLAMFPAGQVAALNLARGGVVEPPWSDTAARLMRHTGAPAIPVFLDGRNSALFHFLGLIHPRLRTALLPRELMNQRGRRFGAAIGRPVAAGELPGPTHGENARFLQGRTELLRGRFAAGPPAPRAAADVAPPAGHGRCRREIEQLPAAQRLLEHGGLVVCLAEAKQIPATLKEIGRCREIAFRAAGEGTGAAVDIDVFDAHYLHLILWDRERGRVAGGYRLAGTDRVLPRFGVHGLYTSSLFRFRRAFLERLGTALELGRSFVLPEYQKNFWPLLLLWKGIGAYVAQNPQYRTLFGPVSISNAYSPVSRALMVAFLKDQCAHAGLASAVRPRTRLHTGRVPGCDARVVRLLARDVGELSAAVTDAESDGKGVPVLLRQYLALGGQIVEFNVDPAFAGALDGLIVVDLLHTPRRLLERYLGKDGAAGFLAYHGADEFIAREPVSA
jgi:putative hemolysin